MSIISWMLNIACLVGAILAEERTAVPQLKEKRKCMTWTLSRYWYMCEDLQLLKIEALCNVVPWKRCVM